MAPNVGQPDSLDNEELVQQNTGCAAASRPFSLELSTLGELGLGTSSRVRSGSGAETEIYFASDVPCHTAKDATFPDASRKSRLLSRSSADSFYDYPTPLTELAIVAGRPARLAQPLLVEPGQLCPASFTQPLSAEPSHFSPTEESAAARGRSRGDRSAGRASSRRFAGPIDEHPCRRSEERTHSRRVLPTLKLGAYNGSTCLKTFLAKFENCSDYYDWSDRERLCHLRASLGGGPAGQVLWDAGQQSSVNKIIRLLKNRFGSLSEEERYRSELKARRRRPGESLQTVYQDIRRLTALAFPGQSGALWEIMARDAFLESLGDPALRMHVLERDPETLEQALKLAPRLEALRQSELEDNWGRETGKPRR